MKSSQISSSSSPWIFIYFLSLSFSLSLFLSAQQRIIHVFLTLYSNTIDIVLQFKQKTDTSSLVLILKNKNKKPPISTSSDLSPLSLSLHCFISSSLFFSFSGIRKMNNLLFQNPCVELCFLLSYHQTLDSFHSSLIDLEIFVQKKSIVF